MNRLEIARRIHREGGFAGSGPTDTANPSGEYRLIVDWADEAWIDIQRNPLEWKFMWDRFEFTVRETSDSFSRDYDLSEKIKEVSKQTVTIYHEEEGKESRLKFVAYPDWRYHYELGDLKPRKPYMFTILPNGNLRLGPGVPDKAYRIQGDYKKAIQGMADNDDEPALPAEYHMLIVWKALFEHSIFIEGTAKYQMVEKKVKRLTNQLILSEGPDIVDGSQPIA